MTSLSWAPPSPIHPHFQAQPSLASSASFSSLPARRRCLGGSCLHIKVIEGVVAVRGQQQVRSVELAVDSTEQLKLVQDVRTKLQSMHPDLPVGKNGRDDDDLLLWFLKDRKFDVDAAVGKLVKALTWRRDFGVDVLTEDSIKGIAATGKAYLHTSPDIEGRPVVVVVAANHVPARDDLVESEKLCIFLIEKALSQLPPGKDKILGIFDLRGFTSKNGDLKFVKFLVDVFFNYYPKRLDQVLFVEAPFIFQPGWNMVKPWLKSYASLGVYCHAQQMSPTFRHETHVASRPCVTIPRVQFDRGLRKMWCFMCRLVSCFSIQVRFCTAEVVRQEYFTPDTVPPGFKISELPSS